MTWVTLVDGVTADADELMTDFYHVAQGDLLPRVSGSFVATSGAYDLGSSAYRWNKLYVNEIATTCTVSGAMVFNGGVSFSSAPVFGSGILATLKKVVCENTLPSGTLPGRLRGSFLYTTTSINTVTVNQITGATLSSDLLTLPAGSYACTFYVPMCFTSGYANRAILFNTTASVTVGLGSIVGPYNSSSHSVCYFDQFTLNTTSALAVQVSTSDSTTVTSGYVGSVVASFGDNEVGLRLFVYQL